MNGADGGPPGTRSRTYSKHAAELRRGRRRRPAPAVYSSTMASTASAPPRPWDVQWAEAVVEALGSAPKRQHVEHQRADAENIRAGRGALVEKSLRSSARGPGSAVWVCKPRTRNCRRHVPHSQSCIPCGTGRTTAPRCRLPRSAHRPAFGRALPGATVWPSRACREPDGANVEEVSLLGRAVVKRPPPARPAPCRQNACQGPRRGRRNRQAPLRPPRPPPSSGCWRD